MSSMKAIKRRRTSVKNTQQIIKAMNLVATSKLPKAKARLSNVRPLFNETQHVMTSAASYDDAKDNIYVEDRPPAHTAYIIITGDRGLCGGYNFNISKAAFLHMDKDKKEKIISVGSKGRDYFRRRRKSVVKSFVGISETALYKDAQEIGEQVIELYNKGEVDEVYIAYTEFESVLSHIPKVEKIFPVSPDPDIVSRHGQMTYEPDINTFLEHMAPMYLDIFIYGAMVESAVCEQAARMTSMDAASKNAEDIIDDLTLMYNRKRQGIITQEITEIVSGANALQ